MGQLYDIASVVKNETTPNANSAQRIGGWMELAATEIETLPSVLAFIDVVSGQNGTLLQNAWERMGNDCSVTFQRNGIVLFDEGAGIVKYTGPRKTFAASYLVALTVEANKIMHVALLLNDSAVIAGTEFEQSTGSRTELTLPGQGAITLNTGDEIGVYIKCSNGSTTYRLDNLNVIIKEI